MRNSIALAALLIVSAIGASAQTVGALRSLPTLHDGVKRQRISSYDRTGGNNDRIEKIAPGQTVTLAAIEGAGTITHLWFTIGSSERYHLRKIVLRAYWDGEKEPSVETPVGDFFGTGFGEPSYWSSAPLAVADRAMNCFFPMPFSHGARIEIENQGQQPISAFYFYVDYESVAPESNAARTIAQQGRFHAWWNHTLTKPIPSAPNLDGKDNYLILDATGRGHYVGTVMHIQGLATGWWGEGDDMIFIMAIRSRRSAALASRTISPARGISTTSRANTIFPTSAIHAKATRTPTTPAATRCIASISRTRSCSKNRSA